MKRLILALGASIAFLLVAGAGGFDKLPMGSEAILNQYRITNITEVGINIYQVDAKGQQFPYVNFGGGKVKFSTYSQFVEYLHREVTRAANELIGSQYYQSQYRLRASFGAVRLQYVGDDLVYAESFYGGGSVGGDLTVINGKVTAESVSGISIQSQHEVGLRLPLASEFLEIEVRDKASGELIFYKDTFYDAEEGDAFTRSGNLYIQDKWLIGNPNWDTRLVVSLQNGGVLTYDGNGDRQMKLTMSLVNGTPTVLVEGLLPNETVQLQVSNDLKHWTNWPTKVRSLQLAAVPSGEQVFFRIAP